MVSFQNEDRESRGVYYRAVKAILRIHNLQSSDAGEYSCQARSDLDVVTKLQARLQGR